MSSNPAPISHRAPPTLTACHGLARAVAARSRQYESPSLPNRGSLDRARQITVPDEVIDLLLARGYDLTRADKASMAHALETFLSDAVLEGA
jgi:hypothetical protein